MWELIRTTEKETRKFRLLALAFVIAGVYLFPELPFFPILGLFLSYFIYILLLPGFILNKVKNPNIIYGMIGIDALFLGAGLYLMGIESPIFILLPLFVLYYSFFFGYKSAIFSAIIFSLVYSGLTLVREEAKAAANIIAIQVPFLFILALLCGYLAKRRLEERREKEELQEIIRVERQAKELLEVAKGIGQAYDMDATLGYISRYSPQLLGLPHCLIALFEDGKLVPKGGNIEPPQNIDLDESTSTAFKREKPIEAKEIPPWAQERKASSLLIIPLTFKKGRIGVLYLFDTSPHPLSREQIRLAQEYSELISAVLFSALSYQQTQAKLRQVSSELESTVLRLERYEKARRKGEIIVGDFRIDGIKEEAYLKGKKLDLTPIEFELLYTLAENAGQPLNRETLLRRIWGMERDRIIVDVTVHRLKKKLRDDAYLIQTVRGKGYMLRREG